MLASASTRYHALIGCLSTSYSFSMLADLDYNLKPPQVASPHSRGEPSRLAESGTISFFGTEGSTAGSAPGTPGTPPISSCGNLYFKKPVVNDKNAR